MTTVTTITITTTVTTTIITTTIITIIWSASWSFSIRLAAFVQCPTEIYMVVARKEG